MIFTLVAYLYISQSKMYRQSDATAQRLRRVLQERQEGPRVPCVWKGVFAFASLWLLLLVALLGLVFVGSIGIEVQSELLQMLTVTIAWLAAWNGLLFVGAMSRPETLPWLWACIDFLKANQKRKS